MFDFDPRDHDPRDDEIHGRDRNFGTRGSADADVREDDWRQPDTSRERDDDARTLGRGPGSDREGSESGNNGRDPCVVPHAISGVRSSVRSAAEGALRPE